VARVVIPTGDFGALSGVVTFIAALGGGVAPVVAGRLTDTTGAPTLAATVAAFSAIAAALAVVQTKRHAVSAGKPPAQEVRTA